MSSLGVYSVPLEPFAAGLGDHKIVTTLSPEGKSRCDGLWSWYGMAAWIYGHLLTHTFPLDRITDAYELFSLRKDGKVAGRPRRSSCLESSLLL